MWTRIECLPHDVYYAWRGVLKASHHKVCWAQHADTYSLSDSLLSRTEPCVVEEDPLKLDISLNINKVNQLSFNPIQGLSFKRRLGSTLPKDRPLRKLTHTMKIQPIMIIPFYWTGLLRQYLNVSAADESALIMKITRLLESHYAQLEKSILQSMTGIVELFLEWLEYLEKKQGIAQAYSIVTESGEWVLIVKTRKGQTLYMPQGLFLNGKKSLTSTEKGS